MKPTVMTMQCVNEDVRSLLYNSQDSDEIESLVFGNAANEYDEEELDHEATTSGSSAGKVVDQTSPLAKAFECNMTLFQTELAAIAGAPTGKYNRLRAFTNID